MYDSEYADKAAQMKNAAEAQFPKNQNVRIGMMEDIMPKVPTLISIPGDLADLDKSLAELHETITDFGFRLQPVSKSEPESTDPGGDTRESTSELDDRLQRDNASLLHAISRLTRMKNLLDL